MKKQSLFICLFFAYIIASGQSFNVPEKSFFQNGTVSLVNFDRFEASNITILNDSIRFSDNLTRRARTISLDEVSYLRVKEGTQMGKWALYGGVVMGASVLYNIINVSLDPNLVFKDNAGITMLGLVAGGVLIGGLIGSAIPNWKTYYFSRKTGFVNSVKPDLYLGHNSVGLSLRFSLN